MSNTATTTTPRAHHSNAPQGTEKTHTLIILVQDRPGSVDRVVGVLRRRRSMLQSLSIAPGAQSEMFRITAQVKDAEVVVDHLVAQIQKVVDVQHVANVSSEQAITRELAIIQVETANADSNAIISTGQPFGAVVIDATPEAVTLEVTGDAAKIAEALAAFQQYGIRDVARSGPVALTRDAATK
ncbi:acetolactate synthase small subunit [Dictyobacter aurantiacus]|uniref:Acetolactate synthase small subunit n=1 Tax=Dictyobacter aurantiacus TaxID=1936993 RepID=A0A401ZHV2_9CHLR|nr:acetolactate synthase small subunit [Dictyobacter aurantiacus]GCE06424.1 acetolactate synthase small subunit [Dictyobacter aurantiacus]